MNKWKKRKIWFCCCSLSIVTLLSTVTIMNITMSSPNSFKKFNLDEIDTKTTEGRISSMKTILIWTKFWLLPRGAWDKIFYLLINKKCPVNNCNIVYRGEYQNLNLIEETADAILFHPMDLYPLFELPRKHRINQPWIAFSLEPPSVINEGQRANHLKKLNNVFNWTMTYRQDSDIVVPYGQFIPREEPLDIKGLDIWEGKVKNGSIGTWMVSHCSTESRRESFMGELRKYITVDVYGKCSNLTCGTKLSIRTLMKSNVDKCNEVIRSHYFYFALENSICKDYVTEKFYLALSLDVIPVVFGGADYSSLAPPHSYINSLEFENPKELADYLTMLAANKTAYNKYFEWKSHFTIQLGHPFTPLICDLCSKLHQREPTLFNIRYPSWYFKESVSPSQQSLQRSCTNKIKDSYEDLHGWFVNESECKWWNHTNVLKEVDNY